MGKATYAVVLAITAGGVLALLQWQQGEIDGLEVRVHTLEGELADLSARMEGLQPGVTGPTLRAASTRPERSGAAAPREPQAALPAPPMASAPIAVPGPPRYGDEQAMRAVVAALESDRPEIRDKVRAVVQEEQEALWAQRRERRQAMWEERITAQLDTLAAEVDLNPAQVDALYGILTGSRDRVAELFQQARQSQKFDGVHEQAAQIRQQADSEAKELLDEAQYGAFRKMREAQRLQRQREHRPPPPDPQDTPQGTD